MKVKVTGYCESPPELTFAPGTGSTGNESVLKDISGISEIERERMAFSQDFKSYTDIIIKPDPTRLKSIRSFLFPEWMEIIHQ